jgi:U3 small nucleolar ribonucleoprotein protein IMP3
MVRKLKHHEQKLLRKVDFVNYPSDDQHRAAEVIRKYSLSNPTDYSSYRKICCSRNFMTWACWALEGKARAN